MELECFCILVIQNHWLIEKSKIYIQLFFLNCVVFSSRVVKATLRHVSKIAFAKKNLRDNEHGSFKVNFD